MARFARGYVGRQSLIVGIPGFGGPKGYMNRGSRDRLYTGEFVDARTVGGQMRGVWRRSDAGPTTGHDPYSALVLAENPLLYWRFGEGDGTTLEDSSPNDRDGTLGAGMLRVAGGLLGDSDTAVELNGSSDYVYNNTWSPNGPFTNGAQRTFVGLWWRDTEAALMTLWAGADAGAAAPIFYLGDGSSHPASRVLFAPNGNSGGTAQWDSAYPGTGRWVHVALEFDEPADQATLYVNGDSKGTVAVPTAWGPSATVFFMLLGAWYAGGGFFFWDGKADEFSIHDGLLGADKIARLFRASRAAGSGVGATPKAQVRKSDTGPVMTAAPGGTPKATARKSDAGPVMGDPSFPSTGVLDDFNRADGGLGANWTKGPFASESGIAFIETNRLGHESAAFSPVYWSAEQFGADQEAWVEIPIPATTTSWALAVQARIANPNQAGSMKAYNAYAYGLTTTTAGVGLERYDNGGAGYAFLAGDTTVSYGAGAALGLRCVGTTIEQWWKSPGGVWTLIHRAIDTAIQAGGYIGVDGQAQNATVPRYDNFGGGPLTHVGSRVGVTLRADRIDRNGPVSDRLVGQQDLEVQANTTGRTVRDGILGGPWYAWARVQGGPVEVGHVAGPAKIQVRKSDAGPVADMVAQGFVRAEARPGVLIVRDGHVQGDVSAYAAAIEGVTRDKDGNAIGSVTVWLFRANGAEDRIFVTETTSDASGNYRVIDLSTSGNHFVYCHKADSPHIFGASDKELEVQLTQIFP